MTTPAHLDDSLERRQLWRPPLDVRFWARVQKSDGCWLWLGAKARGGYGHIHDGGARRTVKAHRLSWEIHNGPIPPGALVLHRCDVRLCVNPAHLFTGTPEDNTKDMLAKGRGKSGMRQLAMTHCKRGHEFTPDNLVRRHDGRRECRACSNARQRGELPRRKAP